MYDPYRTHLSLNRFATDRSSTLLRVFSLVHSRMHSSETFETLLELVRETTVCFYLRKKEGIAAAVFGLIKDPEESGPRSLTLVGLLINDLCVSA